MIRPDTKPFESLRAEQALRHGIAIEPGRDDAGRRVLTITRGAFTTTVPLDRLAEALQQARGYREAAPA